MMKRNLYALLLIGCLLLSMAACGTTKDANAGVDTPAPTKKVEAPADVAESTASPTEAPGDTIILRGEEVLITDLVRTDSGAVQINGGLDVGGYELITDEAGIFYNFMPDNTSIVIQGGQVIEMERNYTP